MTVHLNADGALTGRQKDRANELGIAHMDYRIVVLQNVSDTYKSIINLDQKEVIIQANNPYIVVGFGPNWEDQARKLRGTKIPIIATDVTSTPLIKMGIIPKFIVTFEEAEKRINNKLFDYNYIRKYNIKVVGSKLTRQWLPDDLLRHKMEFERYDTYDECSNVGYFGTIYAKNVLNADKVILIGMDCWNDDIDVKNIHWDNPTLFPPYLNWYVEWRGLLEKSPKGFLVNCTQGGILYVDGMVRADFNRLVIR